MAEEIILETPTSKDRSNSDKESVKSFLKLEEKTGKLSEPDDAAVAEAGEEQPQNFYVGGNSRTIRYYWGMVNGRTYYTLHFYNSLIRKTSHVFVSICEGFEPGMGFVAGGALFHLRAVAPFDGGVSIQVYVDWHYSLPLTATYLVVNP